MSEEKIYVTVDTGQAHAQLAAVDVDAKDTEIMVEQVAANTKRTIAITRQQTIMMASQTWSIVQNSMRLMGITLSAGFSAMINLAMQTVQFMTSTAAMYALVPGGQVSATLFAIQAIAGGLSIAATTISQAEAMMEFMQTGEILQGVKNNTESEYYL